MQFAHREIVKLKGEIRCRIGVGLLLHRKSDIESNGGRIGLGRTAIRGFHDAGSAAGRDDIVANAAPRYERTPALGRDWTEAPRFLIPPRRLIARTRHGTGRQCCGVLSSILAAARQHTCAAENDDSRADDPSAKPLFRLRVFPVAGVRRAWNRPEENRDRARGGGMHRNLFARYYRLWTFGSSCDNTQPACRLVDECRLIEDGALSMALGNPHRAWRRCRSVYRTISPYAGRGSLGQT